MASKARRMAGTQSFTVVTSTGGSKTATFTNSFPAGIYTIESLAGDADLEIYLGEEDGTNVGYVTGGSKAITASAPFKYVTTANANSSDAIIFSLYPTLTNATTLATKTDATWAPPTITAVSPASLFNQNSTTTITGTNFATNAAVQFRKSDDATLVSAKQIVVGSSTSIIATRPDSFSPTDAPYDVIVTNATTGLSGISLNAVTAGSAPAWSTSATLPAFQKTVAYSQAVVATDADTSPTVTYSQVSATLPTGITFSNGTFSGTPSANGGSYSAVIRATDLGGNYADRTFTLAQDKPDAPGIGVATATGATTATIAFTAPAYTGTSTITSYTATSSPAGGTGSISQAGSGTITVTGLTAQTAYTFTVTATNSSGTSLSSSASSSVTTQSAILTVNYLVVAGGGSGGTQYGGGGGAGGYRSSVTGELSGRGASAETALTLSAGNSYAIIVGAGGASKGIPNNYAQGENGTNSSISGTGITTVTSLGGGGGGYRYDTINNNSNGSAGGSGGGGGDAYFRIATGGAGTTGQGYDGGSAVSQNESNYRGSGGGGAGSAGVRPASGGSGGNGVASSITGSSVTRAGGGGGGNTTGSSSGFDSGPGGSGGGGKGATYNLPAVSGSTNTGSGGGGGGDSLPTSGAGGSGVVILSYSGSQKAMGGIVTSSGGNTIHTFNASGNFEISYSAAKATGGVINKDANYFYHVFNSSGTFTPTQSLTTDILVVAGGGSGSMGTGGGGGGAGGFRAITSQAVTSSTAYTVTIGSGGAATYPDNVRSGNGTNSSFSGSGFTTITASGGGAGGAEGSSTPASGGSGGGGTYNSAGASGNSGGYSPVEGYAGAGGTSGGGNWASGGGGGASAAGGSAANAYTAGAGGAGASTSISGGAATGAGQLVSGTYYFAGGGGGSAQKVSGVNSFGGAGGNGGGGAGSADNNSGLNREAFGITGLLNTGGGGGGAGGDNALGGSGGSGIVIIRYPV